MSTANITQKLWNYCLGDLGSDWQWKLTKIWIIPTDKYSKSVNNIDQ